MITLVYVTFPDAATARNIIDALMRNRWIACANLMPIESCYWWEGEINNDDELVGILKTTAQLRPRVEAYVTAHHPYEVPCVLSWEVAANSAYADWIAGETMAG